MLLSSTIFQFYENRLVISSEWVLMIWQSCYKPQRGKCKVRVWPYIRSVNGTRWCKLMDLCLLVLVYLVTVSNTVLTACPSFRDKMPLYDIYCGENTTLKDYRNILLTALAQLCQFIRYFSFMYLVLLASTHIHVFTCSVPWKPLNLALMSSSYTYLLNNLM